MPATADFSDFTTAELRARVHAHERTKQYREGVSHAMTHAHNLRAEIERREALANVAPALLAALRRLVAECNAHLDYEDDEDMQAAVDAAQEVITKAEGR